MQQRWLQSTDVGRHVGCWLLFLNYQSSVVLPGHALRISELFQQQNPFCPCQCTLICHPSEERKSLLEASKNTWKWMDSENPAPASEGNLSFFSSEYQQGLGPLMVWGVASFQTILMALPGLPVTSSCHWNTTLFLSACKSELPTMCKERRSCEESEHFQTLQLLGRRVQVWTKMWGSGTAGLLLEEGKHECFSKSHVCG